MSISEIASRLGGWPRRVLALICLIIAAATAMAARHPRPAGPGRPVVVAARDLAAGTRLIAADVRLASWPSAVRPPGVLTSVVAAAGRQLGGAIRANEAITETRLAGSGLTAGLTATLQAVPVPVASADLPFLRVGDWIDLLTGGSPDGAGPSSPARVVAEAVRVLAVTSEPPSGSGDGTRTVVVAADRATTLKMAAASGQPLLAAVRIPP